MSARERDNRRRRRWIALLLGLAVLLAIGAAALAAAGGEAPRRSGSALDASARAGDPAAHGARPLNVRRPTISGITQVGRRLKALPGAWAHAPRAYLYRWLRCNAAGKRCHTIAGASGSYYVLIQRDLGATLRVSVTASNRAGRSGAALSAQTHRVSAAPPKPALSGVRHLEYVFNDGPVSVYDIDNGFKLVETFNLPGTNRGVRGVAVSPATHMMFVSFGGDGGANGNGSVLAYDLVRKAVVWSVNLSTGIDSGAVSADGKLLYMPDGELSSDGNWYVLDTANGSVVGKIETRGRGPHDGVLSADGKLLQMGDRNYPYLSIYDTQTGRIERESGPLAGGVRPNTINGADTVSFTTATGLDGFQVSSILTGKVLYTEEFAKCTGPFTTCSHGVSLSPDSSQAYVIDTVHKAVQVWDVHGVAAGVAPVHLATIPVDGLEGEEQGCAYDCGRDGWVQHTLDGRYVFVGDSGDVIETATQRVVAKIENLLNTRKFLEIDFSGGVPVAASGRQGIGYPP